MSRLIGLIGLLCCTLFAAAHEIRPGFLDVRETAEGQYTIQWKIPTMGGRGPQLELDFSEACALEVQSTEERVAAVVQRYQMQCDGSIRGQKVRIQGLESTLIDVLLRIEWMDGTTETLFLQPDRTEIQIPEAQGRSLVVWTYLILGVEHILFGYDHLLFVLGLMLLISGWKKLITTITAFTLAHSITLALSALNLFSLPQAPVEATIALSIVFLAREYLLLQQGQKSLSAERPWIVALAFGLLHGLGFAGALREIGLPKGEVLSALLSFNIGVELGQIAFVLVLFILVFVSSLLVRQVQQRTDWLSLEKEQLIGQFLLKGTAYFIGGLGMYWLLDRV
ncbi:MAG: HupE/UreJ family protein [Bacteroidota bacterium]